MDETRRHRIESAIREELSIFLSREIKDPRVPPLTLTQVVLTKDASQATLFIMPFGTLEEDPEKRDAMMEDCLEGLSSASGFMRKHLTRVLSIRHIPELIFKQDKGLENSMRVHELLKKIENEKKPT